MTGDSTTQAGRQHWHPWRRFRDLTGWTLRWAHLPDGLLGHTDFRTRTVTLADDLTQAERRCTIAHETEHIHRGPVTGCVAREERLVDERAARKLITLDALVDALLWSLDEYELADELWVDVPTVRVRLSTLSDAETRTINARLDGLERSLTC